MVASDGIRDQRLREHGCVTDPAAVRGLSRTGGARLHTLDRPDLQGLRVDAEGDLAPRAWPRGAMPARRALALARGLDARGVDQQGRGAPALGRQGTLMLKPGRAPARRGSKSGTGQARPASLGRLAIIPPRHRARTDDASTAQSVARAARTAPVTREAGLDRVRRDHDPAPRVGVRSRSLREGREARPRRPLGAARQPIPGSTQASREPRRLGAASQDRPVCRPVGRRGRLAHARRLPPPCPEGDPARLLQKGPVRPPTRETSPPPDPCMM